MNKFVDVFADAIANSRMNIEHYQQVTEAHEAEIAAAVAKERERIIEGIEQKIEVHNKNYPRRIPEDGNFIEAFKQSISIVHEASHDK